MPPRTVAVIGAACLLAGWLLASVMTPPVARLQSLGEQPPAPSAPPPDQAYVERLRWHRQRTPEPRVPQRNPFEFGRAAAPSPGTPDAGAAADSVVGDGLYGASASAEREIPPIALAGIGIRGDEHTAVLTDGTAVRVVKRGEVFAGYTVVEITDRGVTIEDGAGRRFVIDLP